MIKTIFWDFDGVILDSMKIKGDGFVELFQEYENQYLKKIEEYHYANGGISRFDKIRYFYNEIINQDISEDKILILADKFSIIIEKKLYDKSNLIFDSVSFIKKNYYKYNFHIVSGAEHNELNKLCDYFELSIYFKSIDGSPIKKDILIQNILKQYNYKKEESILIGDSFSDYNASINNSIDFYGYNNNNLKEFKYIEKFEGFYL